MNHEFEADPNVNGRSDGYNHDSVDGAGPANGELKNRLNGHAGAPPVDAWTVADLLTQRWHWMVIGTILGCAALFVLGIYMVKPKFTAVGQLLRYETPGANEAITGTPLTMETFAGLIASPELLRRVSEKLDPPIPPDRLVKQMKVDPQPESDIIKVLVAAREPQQAVHIANVYLTEVTNYTRELQARQAQQIAHNYLRKQLDQLDADIATLQEQFRGMPSAGQVTNKLQEVSGDVDALKQNLAATSVPNPITIALSEKLQTSLAELTELQSKYTEKHPFVQQKQAEIESLEDQITNAKPFNFPGMNHMIALGPNGRALDPAHEIIGAKLNSMEYVRIEMANRVREAELYAKDPPGVVRVFAPASMKTTQSNHRKVKIGIVTIFGGCVGIACALGLVLLTELVDNRVKSTDDLRRITRLPVLTTLGNLEHMSESSRAQWAFRTWTMLQGRLGRSQNHGLVCGITSSGESEGRSTWIRLLAEAASLSGFRVLTVATQPSSSQLESPNQITEETLDQAATMNTSDQTQALTHDVLATPSRVTEQLTAPGGRPVVHIPLPGWVWNVDRRRQWGAALNQWRKIDNLVIFVELPPASMPEAVLLGSNLPNLVWLADSGQAEAGETRTQLQTLRDARCNLVGAVLNREQSKPLRKRFPRWFTSVLFAAAVGATSAFAQSTVQLPVEPPPGELEPAVANNASQRRLFSVLDPSHRAAWQTNLTLGPGDILTFSLMGEPLLTQTEVPIAPDGRVSFLDARDIVATGLTIDQLRAKIDEALGQYRRVARCTITPVSYRSKRYFVLGKVVQRGVYVLDRPTTIIEALARAKGIETGVVENDTLDLADYSRAFLMRDGSRMEINFEKLFQQGDLSQNIQIEPGDYIYFPPANIVQVYVLGEVGLPGPVTYRPDMTLMAALSYRGGFNEKAYKSRVLVVRGSLNQPEAFAVDTMAITAGRNPDFKLEPKDIVYVSHRPFWRVEDLLDQATTAFMQAVVATWTGTEIIKP